MKRRNLLLATLALATTLAVGTAPAGADVEEIAVIVHKSNPVGAMNRSQLSTLFKARSIQFPGGGRASPVNLPPENPLRQEFDWVVLGLKPDEVERFWLDSKIRSGVGSPRKLSGPAAVLRYVGAEETAIGYVPAADVDGSVRVVARVRGGQVRNP
jgi:hypothetical protein